MKKVFKLLVSAFFTAFVVTIPGCKKEAEIPVLTTAAVTHVTQTTALTGGTVTSSGGADVTARGVCWSDGHTPTVDDSKTIDGMGSGSFASNLTGLTANTTYYVRAYATNSVGTAYGNMITFSAMEILPATVTTSAIASILSTYAVTGGNITSNGGAKVMEWGVCWSTSENPTTSSVVYNITGSEGGSGVFTATLTGLTVGTTYFIRAYATNSAGTAYGDQLSFTTLNNDEISPVIFYPGSTYGSVSDIDGNLYKTIQIGSQIWMAENLKTTKFNDGADIPLVESNSEWSGLFVPGYCYYNIDPGSYKQIYGALYNWYAVNTGKLCPDGWRVPSSEDIEILNDNYGYGSTSGNAMREAGIGHWAYPNTGATNESGWTALPGGTRLADGRFEGLGFYGSWWSIIAPLPAGSGGYAEITYNNPAMVMASGSESSSNGISVRCIKEN